MAYNLSFMDNVTSVQDVATGVNDLSGGWLFGMILITIWIIVLISAASKGRPIGELLLVSSLVVGIIGGVLMGLGYIAPFFLSIPAIGVFAGIMVLVWGN